jgi:hypothetical protein
MIIQKGNNRCHETIIMPLTTLPNVSEKLLKLFQPPQSFPLSLTQRRVHHQLPANHRQAGSLALHLSAVPDVCPVRALSPRSGRWEPSLELARTSPCSMTWILSHLDVRGLSRHLLNFTEASCWEGCCIFNGIHMQSSTFTCHHMHSHVCCASP